MLLCLIFLEVIYISCWKFLSILLNIWFKVKNDYNRYKIFRKSSDKFYCLLFKNFFCVSC